MNLVGFVILLCLALQCGLAQVISLGSCPKPSAMSNFEAARYAGDWYENRKYFAIFEAVQRCVKATYSVNDDGTLNVRNQGIGLLGDVFTAKGIARRRSQSVAKLGVTFTGVPFSPTDAPYWILGTDYDNYAVAWSCNNYGLFNTQTAWILTRDPNPEPTIVNRALGVLDANRLSRSPLRATKQTNCSERKKSVRN